MRLAPVVLLFLALAAPARAATAQVAIADSCGSDVACGKYDAGHDVPVVLFIGSPGEANRVVASRVGDEVTISDPGAVVTVGESCRSADPHTAICTAAPSVESLPSFVAQLGDGDDSVSISGAPGVRTKLDGGPGDDELAGGNDSDTLDGGPGADRIDGGKGDTLSFAQREEAVTVDLAAATTSDGDVLHGIGRVEGGQGADRLLGGQGADTLDGGPGNDLIRGGPGADILAGDLGADTVEGGSGDDGISGDPPQGDDYYTPRIHLSRDVLRGGSGNDELSDTGGANHLEGGTGDDLLEGGSGPDRLVGGPGADWLSGHRGADRLSGGAGRDEMRGGSGADRLTGGAGVDRLFGGSGTDRLLARDGSADRADCGRGRDRATVDAKDRVRACERLRRGVYTSRR